MPLLNEYGQVIDESGHIVPGPDGNPIKITGAVPQTQFDEKLNERMKRAQEAADKAKAELIAAHQRELVTLQAESQEAKKLRQKIQKLEGEIEDKEAYAASKAQEATVELRQTLGSANKQIEFYKGIYQNTVLENDIVKAAVQPDKGVVFHNPNDLINALRERVKWTEIKDGETPTGRYQYSIVLDVKDPESGITQPTEMSAADAALVIAQSHKHYIRPVTQHGAGYTPPTGGGAAGGQPQPKTPAGQEPAHKNLTTHEKLAQGLNDSGQIKKPLHD